MPNHEPHHTTIEEKDKSFQTVQSTQPSINIIQSVESVKSVESVESAQLSKEHFHSNVSHHENELPSIVHPTTQFTIHSSTYSTTHPTSNLTEDELTLLAQQPEELFGVYDEEYNYIGLVPRKIVHREGLLHKAVNGFLVHNGQVLLQQRSKYKLSEPLKWDVSVAEHIQYPESHCEAVLRGLKEELGLDIDIYPHKIVSLRDAHKVDQRFTMKDGSILHDYEITELYLIEVESDVRPSIKMLEAEVESVQWISIHDLPRLKGEVQFTQWAYPEMDYLLEYYNIDR